MFFKRKNTGVNWLIVGLGNPGKKYEATRHNAGFKAMDALAEDFGISIKRSRFSALCGDGIIDGQHVLLAKPQTFMNLSGQAVLEATSFYKIPAQRVIVLCDDVTLAPGVLRVRASGSSGGQKGLKSIITFIGEDFARIRIGVGDRPNRDYDMADWVLSRFTAEEEKLVSARYADIPHAVKLIMAEKLSEAMGLYNGEGRK